jgi:RNA-directed DNA polymerase
VPYTGEYPIPLACSVNTAGQSDRKRIRESDQKNRLTPSGEDSVTRYSWHQPVDELGRWLRSVVQGYFNYHAVPGNLASLKSFRLEVSKRWLRALRRRSQKSRMSWAKLAALVECWLPFPKILHPYPNLRFDAKHLR